MTVDKQYPRCFMDIEIDEENVGRIIVELFMDACPITSENFRALCTGEKGLGKTTDKPLHYKGAPFHRVVKNFVVQGGDFVAGNGTGGESIYGGQFKDENFDIPHDKPFLLSMSNRGKDSNGSQFFITTQAAPHLNKKHTVFGQVVQGQEVVTKIENLKTDQGCRPIKDVKISNCGELVLKIKQKERKRKPTTESSQSDTDSSEARERSRKKRKKHAAKKHKRERKDLNESNSTNRNEEDPGCMVDPEEIPFVPSNNFLMRRTSPASGDRNRRDSPRESYSYHRPERSRSGRKIKGRGFMRYRTPSRSTSRSGSETPPHWKQAQSRLRKIKDVVLPPKTIIPAEDSGSQSEDPDNPTPPMDLFRSRLGMVSRSGEKQKDARVIMRENRWNRDWSPEESPPRKAKATRAWGDSSPLKSSVVVTSNFQRNLEPDRFRRNDWQGGRRGRSPERKFQDFSTQDSNRKRLPNPHQNRKESEKPQSSAKVIKKNFKSLTHDLFRYRKDHVSSDESADQQKEVKVKDRKDDKPKSREEKTKPKESNLPKDRAKKFKSLAHDLFRYRKDHVSSDESGEVDTDKKQEKRDKIGNRNSDQEKRDKIGNRNSDQEKRDKIGSRNSDQEKRDKYSNKNSAQEQKKDKISNKTSDQEKKDKYSSKNSVPPKKNVVKKNIKALENDLFKYRKDMSDYSSDGSSSEPLPTTKKSYKDHVTLPKISEECSTGNLNNETLLKTEASDNAPLPTSSPWASKVRIPGILDSNSNETSHDDENRLDPSNTSGFQTNTLKEDAENKSDNDFKMKDEDNEKFPSDDNTHFRSIKEKRRWDVQDMDSLKQQKVQGTAQVLLNTEVFDGIPPNVIPLPEETGSITTTEVKSSSYQGTIQEALSVAEKMDIDSRSEDSGRSRSQSPVAKEQKNINTSPLKPSKTIEELTEELDQKKSSYQSQAIGTKKNIHHSRSRSRSPITKISPLKAKDRSPSRNSSKSPIRHSPIKRRRSQSPDKRTKRSRSSPNRRSKSPAGPSRRAETKRNSKSRSRSRSVSLERNRNRRRRSRSPSRNRGSRFRRYSDIRNRSPDRRGGFQRRYAKSPSFRGHLGNRGGTRRSRSHSAARRRRRARSSSSSSSSSRNSSSSDSDRRKKTAKRTTKGRGKRSSSSSSSRSKKSDTESD